MEQTQKKDHSFFYLLSTIAFIIVGIILTAIINTTTSHDIRSRASATTGITATAIVSEVDPTTNILAVTGLTFTSSPQKDMGNWTIDVPTSVKLDALTTGAKVQITIDPASMNITSHTMSAKDVKKK